MISGSSNPSSHVVQVHCGEVSFGQICPLAVEGEGAEGRGGEPALRLVRLSPVAGEGQENLRIALDRVEHWTSNGAQLSPAVARLVKEYSAKVAA